MHRKFLLESDAVTSAEKAICKTCRSWSQDRTIDALVNPAIQAKLASLRPRHKLVRLHVHPSNQKHFAVVADLILYSPETKHWYIRTRKIGVLQPG